MPNSFLVIVGALFKGSLPFISSRLSDEEVGALLLRRYVFVHVDGFADKLECLLFMLRKLFSFAKGQCLPDNADALMNHELLLPGQLVGKYQPLYS
jgi:DNA-directed RNA polymerase I subunit RPA2